MKARNMKTQGWSFRPHKDSKLKFKVFKYKSDLMKYLNNNFREALNGEVALTFDTVNMSGTKRTWFVWYNDYSDINTPLKIELRQELFRGRKYITKRKTVKTSKESKRWFMFSDKVINLMCALSDTPIGTELHKRQTENLIKLFYKRGYKDIDLNSDEYKDVYNYEEYLTGAEPIPYSYWCDRCNSIRCAVIIENYKKLYGQI